MAYLVDDLWIWLPLAATAGMAVASLFWWRKLERMRTRHRAKLHRVTQNWEYVESRLSVALEELHAVRAELAERTRERDELVSAVSNESMAAAGAPQAAPGGMSRSS